MVADDGPHSRGCRRTSHRTLFLSVSSLLVLVVASTICKNYRYRGDLIDRVSNNNNSGILTERKTEHDNNIISSHHKSYTLPSLEYGGIIFYLHIPKTGGTTIRELIKYRKNGRRSRVHYIYLTGPREYNDTMQLMKDWVVRGTDNQEVVFIEFHALERNCPTFLHLSQNELPRWKNLANEHNVPFFSFTILREPVAMAISFFNYYHGIPQNPKGFGIYCIEDIFAHATIANPQCLFMARNEDAYTKTGKDLRDSLTRDDCRQAYKSILHLFDWVGTTDRLGNETLLLLRRLFQSNQSTQRLIRNLNKTANTAGLSAPIHLRDLNGTTIQYIRRMTSWDQELYDAAKKGEFPADFGRWSLS
ncbi:expressed unknown protein [Seminavis robusta]|uniref:Uncharacterized protein n=1 Tax=Seminavis robusta TaxID=568900 RepID=A0A9N8EN21_9STRA|nr:expressed unknown protein [Seminavis robusta]|eukprot:Sro1263_g257180.1 n/a (361) ;mRNA; r:3602-4764